MDAGEQIGIPDIIDNSIDGDRLSDVLNRVLTSDVHADIATAYFNIEGFTLIKDKLTKVKGLKLLLGREPVAGIPHDALSSTTTGEDMRTDTEEAMNRRETPQLIKDMVDFIQHDSVEVRHYTSHFLHAKAYMIDGVPLIGTLAIHGSSNFTAAGLTRQGELNSVRKESGAVKGIKDWFERYWSASEDFKNQFVEIFTDFTVKYTPFEIYMKALYEYFKDKFNVEVQADGPSPIFLADFQRDGYLTAETILTKYGGVLLADSVGLGKTYLALKLLDQYAYHLREKALIVCPAQLRDVLWLKKLDECRIFAHIRSQEELGREEFPFDEFIDCDLVLVDESHNFRNGNTNRYEKLSKLLTLGKPKKLVLMTATPVNNSIFDLHNQIRLIARDKDDFFSAAGIRSLWGYFWRAEQEKDHLYDLLEEITVRRSRHYIRKNYPNAIIDGKKIHFPDRTLHTACYSLEDVYDGLYEEVATTIENLTLASYSIDAYRKDVNLKQLTFLDTLKERLIAQGKTQKQMEDLTWRLGRQLSLVHILRTLYLKRLESSIKALRISLERQASFQKRFLEALDKGRLLDATNYRKIYEQNGTDEQVEGETEEEMINRLPSVDSREYFVDEIKEDVRADIKALESILRKLPKHEDIPATDDKLDELKRLLVEDLKGKKVVIFSYFKDTTRYIYSELNNPGFRKLLGHSKISVVDSGVSAADRKERIVRFAPKANENAHYKDTHEDIDLLISTDVLSEGQNLQDADTVINYDLHWNPVRMIQRAGRIDRIGSEFDIVHVYNFFPEDRLESLLNLVERLYQKLDAIRRSVGSDASTLGETIDPKDFNAIRRLEAEDESILDELEQASELTVGEFLQQELLEFLKQAGGEKLKRIPVGVGSSMKKDGQRGLFVYLKGGDRHFWSYYDLKTGKITERKLDIMRIIKCDEKTARFEPDFEVYDVIDKVKEHIVNRFRQLKASPLTFKAPQSHILNLLQTQRGERDVDHLINYYNTPLPDALLRHLRKAWNEYLKSQNLANFLTYLDTFAQANPLAPVSPLAEKIQTVQKEDLKLICWLAVV